MSQRRTPADASDVKTRRNRVDALRQAINEGAKVSHRAVEIVAVQDAARPLHEPELQVVARGIEVLGKATWILNERLINGQFRSARAFGHHLVQLLEAIEAQAVKRHQPSVLEDPVLPMIALVAEDFADGGRFRPLDALSSGEPFFPPYLAWNGLQMATTACVDVQMEQAERSAYLRAIHTAALQRLERSLARHILSAQRDLWGDAIVSRSWLEKASSRPDEALSEPIPLEINYWKCGCEDLDRRVSIWAPVEN